MNWFWIFLLGVLGTVKSINPGIGLKFNEAGLHAVGQYAEEFIEQNFERVHIPNIKTKSYEISNTRIVELNPGQISLFTKSPNKIGVSVTGSSVTATTSWSASLSFWGTLSGDARVFLGGISITQKVILGKTPNGAPHFSVGQCEANIDTITITVSHVGWIKFIVESVVRSPSVDRIIKDEIAEELCSSMDEKLENYLEIANSDYPVNFPIDKYVPHLNDIIVNIGLTLPPRVTSSSITLFFNGRSYNSESNPDQQFPFLPPPVPSFGQSDQMVQGMLSQFVLNTLLYSLWQTDDDAMSYSQEQISNVLGVQVNARMLAQTIPEFNSYIDRPLRFAFHSPEAFRVRIRTSGIAVNGEVSAKINAILPNNNVTVIADNIKIKTEASLWVENNSIHWNITQINVQPLTTGPASATFKHYFDTYGVPIIRQYSDNRDKNEFTLPTFYGFCITQPSITFDENVVVVGGSIEQVLEEENREESQT